MEVGRNYWIESQDLWLGVNGRADPSERRNWVWQGAARRERRWWRQEFLPL